MESKWEAAMEAELGEMDAEGRSERPPYAPGNNRRAELRTGESLPQAWPPAHFPQAIYHWAQLLDPSEGSDPC